MGEGRGGRLVALGATAGAVLAVLLVLAAQPHSSAARGPGRVIFKCKDVAPVNSTVCHTKKGRLVRGMRTCMSVICQYGYVIYKLQLYLIFEMRKRIK